MRTADYEARVLRSALLRPERLLHKVVYTLRPEDFTDVGWRRAFEVIKARAGSGLASTQTLMDALMSANLDPSEILKSWDQYYSEDDIGEPMGKIQNRAALQKLKVIYEQGLRQTTLATTDAKKHVLGLLQSLSDIQSNSNDPKLSDQIDTLKKDAQRYEGNSLFGVPTQLHQFDWTTRGMQAQHLWIMGGYTSVGKSWFAIRFARENILNGRKTLYISLEMSATEILWRMAVQEMNDPDVDMFKAKTKRGLSGEKIDSFYGILEMIKAFPLTILDNLMGWEEVRLKILHYIYAKGVSCIVVDYLQNIVVEKAKSEYESMNIIVRELQRIAVENNVFVLCLSQVNRESNRSPAGTTFGFKGSGNIENAADIAIVIRHLDDKHKVLDIGKNRSGVCDQIKCAVDLSRGSIVDEGKYVPPEGV